MSSDELGDISRLAANILRRGGMAGVSSDSELLVTFGDLFAIREQLMGYADEHHDQDSSCCPRVSSDELGDVLRLAANACRCGGVVGIISDSGYLKESRESKEIH